MKKNRTACRAAALSLLLSLLLVFPMTAKADSTTYSRDGYTLVFIDQSAGLSPTTKQRLIDTFFAVYPQMAGRFNPSAVRQVAFTIDPAYDGVAYTAGTSVVFSANWFAGYPNDIDCATHELMHVVQAYPGYDPVWLVEGIADYARYRYGLDNPGAGWRLPDYASNQNYTDGYSVTARFLVWVEAKLDNYTIVNRLDARLRSNTYTPGAWNEITGYPVDQLWGMYAENPSLSGGIFVIGDVNGDAGVTVSDLIELRAVMKSGASTSEQLRAGDLNADGDLTGADAALLMSRLKIVPGDVNGDGEITSLDIMLIRKLMLEGAPAGEMMLAGGDLDGDGGLRPVDVMLIRKLMLG